MKIADDIRIHKIQFTDSEIDVINKALESYVFRLEYSGQYYNDCADLRDAMFSIDIS